MATTIQISDSVKNTLEKMKMFERESYNEIIERMIEDEKELSAKAKAEIEERIKSPKFVSNESARKRMGI